jgi:hypothetical protein
MAIIKNKFGGVIEAGDSSCVSGLMNSVLSGSQNTNTAQCYTTIVSGLNNTISGSALNGSAILSGQSNTMSGGYRSVIAGGWQNTTSNMSFATISGGRDNTIGAWYGTVSGGWNNTASGNYSYVGGGKTNIASGVNSTVLGGCANTASGACSVVLGGSGNSVPYNGGIAAGTSNVSGFNSLVVGLCNISSSNRSIAAGYQSCVTGGHGIAVGWNARATGDTSSALNSGKANGARSLAVNFGCANGQDSFSANCSLAVGSYSSAFGPGAYGYNNGQVSIGDRISYYGDAQFSILTKKLNTGQVSSGGTYSFDGFQFRNGTFGSGVDQMYYLKVKILIAPRSLTGTVTGLVRGDLYTAEYTLAANVSTTPSRRRIIGTPQLERSFSDPNMSTTTVAFTMDGDGNIVVSVTPATWTDGGTLEFRGTMTIESSELGLYN